MSDTPPVDEAPSPPSVPANPEFPARSRFVRGGVGVGLVALIVVLLTLPTGEHAGSTTPREAVAAAVPPAAPPAAVAPPEPTPAAPPVAAAGAKSSPTVEPATLNARALPRGAVLRVDGKTVAKRHFVVEPGRHVLDVALTGHASVRDTILVKAGENVTWSPKLVSLPPAKFVGAAKPPRPAANPAPAPPPKRANIDDVACREQLAAAAWTAAYQPCVRAARAGSAASARAVGLLFQHGNGVRRSDDSAAAWFTIAARDGDADAMFQLGDAYERGHGVHKDQAAALDWYTRGANAGNAAAQYTVGEAYEKGRLGAAKDRAKALAWYRKAAAQGQKDAANRLHDLGP